MCENYRFWVEIVIFSKNYHLLVQILLFLGQNCHLRTIHIFFMFRNIIKNNYNFQLKMTNFCLKLTIFVLKSHKHLWLWVPHLLKMFWIWVNLKGLTFLSDNLWYKTKSVWKFEIFNENLRFSMNFWNFKKSVIKLTSIYII